ncbi:MAG: hypothetical protein OEL84_09210 [Nitrosopumilus sp.]|nr:hypothetical protein [Nitrosopumilus sp.]
MRFVNWNIQWMNNWFVNGNKIGFKDTYSGITSVDALAKRVSNVILSSNPDVITIEEGPSSIKEMELFVQTYLSENNNTLFDVHGGIDGGAQKIYALVKKSGVFKEADLASDDASKELENVWEVDVDGDLNLDSYDFTRLPLILDGKYNNQEYRIVILHTKSKYVHEGKSRWNDPVKRPGFVKDAVKNRRRISAESMRLRIYLDELLEQDPGKKIIVTGDFNDGPGIDYFERYYVTHNTTDILLGSTYYPSLQLKHTFLDKVPADKLYTAVFNDFVDNINNRPLLLDHILVSPALKDSISKSGILHDEFESEIDTNSQGRQRDPSDHRPVFLEIE